MRFVPADIVHRDALVRELMRPLAQYLAIAGATEVAINEPGQVFVEVGATWQSFRAPELTMDQLLSLARAVATFTEQGIGSEKPMLSATLPGGERVQIMIPPVVPQDCISFSIRIPSSGIKTLHEYETEEAFARYVWAEPAGSLRGHDLSTTDEELMACLRSRRLGEFLRTAVQARKNIAVVGDTGSGKTTLMKALCQVIPQEQRVVTIEDVRELLLPNHPNTVHLLYSKGGQGLASVTPAELIAANMRMKPDRVLLAELRGSEAFDFLKLLTTGHAGSITSFHAESCALAVERFVFCAREHEQAATYNADALKRLVALTLDVIVHVVAKRAPNSEGSDARKERYVSEVLFDPIGKLSARFGDATVHRAHLA